MKKFKELYSDKVGNALWPLVEHLILDAYNRGYSDACEIYQNSIDKLKLNEEWSKRTKELLNE